MNTLKIILKESGSTAEVQIDFRLYRNAYRNSDIDIYVPDAFVGVQTAVKIGGILTDTNGKKITTEPYYAEYVRDEEVGGKSYKVYNRTMPSAFLNYAGQQTLVVNVVNEALNEENVLVVTSVITSQEVVIDVLDSAYLNDPIVEPTPLEEVWGVLNEKQDKQDNLISNQGVLVNAEQKVVNSLNALNTQVGDNITTLEQQGESISDLSGRVSDLEDYIVNGERPIGEINTTTLPTDAQVSAYVLAETGRQPKLNDVVVVNVDDDGVITTYKYLYTETGWIHYQTGTQQKAQNDKAGLVEGTEGISGYNQPISANIVNGQIVNVKYKDGNGTYQQVGNAIDSNKGNITNIINGTQVVGEAVKATEDSNGDNIAQTYAKANNVYTKSQSDSKYLPKTYTDVYYYSADGLVDDVPTEPADGVQFTANVPAVGEVKLAEASRTLENAYHFTKNSTDESRIWLVTDTDTTLQLRLLTYVTLGGVSTLLASQLTSDIVFTANQPQEVILDSIYNGLQNNEIDVDAGETFTKEIYVSSTDNTATTIDLISSSQYASSFNLAVQSIVFNINTINGIKSVSIASTDWTDNGDGTYSVVIPQTQHQQAPTNRYMLSLQQEVSSGVYEYIAFTPEVDIDGNITITSDNAIDCDLLIASAVQSNSRGVLELTNPTTLSIDYNQVGVLRVEQNETATPLTLNDPSDTGLYYTFIVANKSTSTEAIEVNSETIAIGQAKQFMWVGEWILGIPATTTGDIYDNVNEQSLNNTLLDLQSEINGKQDTLTFDSTPTQNSTNPVTSGGIKSYVDNIVGDIETLLGGI